ncbi:N-acetylmuramoyl-L-alanine amidase, partial [Eremococcus coleocola]|uniref:N-acetylmuramoyl-L-alanine amidase n=1 Tax=Eremococcus coleocola TaxID=88132 RepID=UPI000559678E
KASTGINKPEETKKDDSKKEESKPEINTNAKTHTVKKGEYLYSIARKYGLTVSKLKALNNLSSNVLLTGQVLKVTEGEIDSTITNPETSPTKISTDNLPDLSRANAIEVDYDVKLNSKTEPFRTSINLASRPINAVNKFGQRFTVTREFYENGQKYLELSQNGMVKGYVPASAAVKVPKNSKVIYLDAGHGGSETGAYSFGTAEKNLNLNITRRLASDLRKQGYTVYESRTTDKAIPLNQRTIEPNRIMPDLYLSVHHNAMPNPGSARGIETLYHNSSIDEEGYMTMAHHKYTNLQAESKRLADTVQSYLIAETGAVNRGARPQNLHVTRTNDAPAILVELGFQDNYSEYKNLTSPSYQNKLIKGLLKGINAFLN